MVHLTSSPDMRRHWTTVDCQVRIELGPKAGRLVCTKVFATFALRSNEWFRDGLFVLDLDHVLG